MILHKFQKSQQFSKIGSFQLFNLFFKLHSRENQKKKEEKKNEEGSVAAERRGKKGPLSQSESESGKTRYRERAPGLLYLPLGTCSQPSSRPGRNFS